MPRRAGVWRVGGHEGLPVRQDQRRRPLIRGAAQGFLLTQPERITSVAGLSGFLPEDSQVIAQRQPIIGKRLFLAHGTQDRLVPVERARQAVDILETAGAQVVYCEDDVGHKLSASCFRGLEAFYSGQANC